MYRFVTNFLVESPLNSLPQLIYIGSEAQNTSSYLQECKRRADFPLYYTFQYTLSGEGFFEDASGRYRVPAGHGFLMQATNPDVVYGYPEGATEPWDFVYVEFRGGNASQLVSEMLEKFGPIYQLPEDSKLVEEWQSYGHYDRTTVHLSSFYMADLLYRMLNALGRGGHDQIVPAEVGCLLRKVTDYIRNSLQQPLYIQQIADRFNVSREHLSRLFKQQLNMTPKQYINRERIRLACHLLKTTSLNNQETGFKSGFDSAVHFARTFKKLTGMTPGQFRRIGTSPVFDL